MDEGSGTDDQPVGALPDDYLLVIGGIAVAHAGLEFSALMILTKLINPEDSERGVKLVGGDDVGLQLQRIARLARLPSVDMAEEIRTEILAWVKDVEQVKETRNRLLHSVWTEGVSNNEPRLRLRLRRGGKPDFGITSLSEMRALLDRLIMLDRRAYDLLVGLGAQDDGIAVEEDEIWRD